MGAGTEIQTLLERATVALGRSVATLTIPERALIIAETLEEPMSPVQFAADWGLERTATQRHFRRLADAGFLKVVGEGPSRGGRKPLLYAATKNLLYRGRDWEDLSQEDREGHSFVVFITLMSRISLAINAKTMDRDLDRHFTWKALEINRATWEELMRRLDDVLDWVTAAEADAKKRIAAVGRGPDLIPATVALAGFRSPARWELREALGVKEDTGEASDVAKTQQQIKRTVVAYGPKAAKLLIPERALILADTLERPMSSTQLAAEWGLDKHATARHFRRMEKAGFLERLDKRDRPRGAVDGSQRGRSLDLYVATQNLLFRLDEWERLPRDVREGHSFVVFITLMARISLSINAKTMDRDLGRHFTWKALEIDQEAWDGLISRQDDLLDWVIAAEADSREMLRLSDEERISATVALAGFRSPKRSELLRNPT